MPYTFYMRDHWVNGSIQEVGEIHRVKYDHHEKTVEILDHEDPMFEIASREFGYTIDSECLNFRQLVIDAGIVKALTSMKVFPGSILIRIATEWIRDLARRFDERVETGERFADGTSFSADKALDLTLEYLDRYVDPNVDMPIADDDGGFKPEDDIGEMVSLGGFWIIQETIPNKNYCFTHTIYAVQDIVMACAWYPPIGRHANWSKEVEEKVTESVNNTFSAINVWLKELGDSEGWDKAERLFRRVAYFEKMLRTAAAITKKYQQEL